MLDPVALTLAELLKIGLPGVIIAALAWAYWRQVLRNEMLSDRRVEDAQKMIPMIEANTGSRDRHTEAIESLSELIRNQQRRR